MGDLLPLEPLRRATAQVHATSGLALPAAERAGRLRDQARVWTIASAAEMDDLGREVKRVIVEPKRILGRENPPASRSEAGRGGARIPHRQAFTRYQVTAGGSRPST